MCTLVLLMELTLPKVTDAELNGLGSNTHIPLPAPVSGLSVSAYLRAFLLLH